MKLRLQTLTTENFADYEGLTCKEANGKSGCYCAFWHQKWNSLEEWERRQKEEPLKNRDAVKAKVNGGFHVGVLAYEDDQLVAWISIGPVAEFQWSLKRALDLGAEAFQTAGIFCFSIDPKFRHQGYQQALVRVLKSYAVERGWKRLEAWPFDPAAFEKHGEKVAWPGHPEGFEAEGFTRTGPHWLNHPDWPRSIYELKFS